MVVLVLFNDYDDDDDDDDDDLLEQLIIWRQNQFEDVERLGEVVYIMYIYIEIDHIAS